MQTLILNAQTKYEVFIGSGILAKSGELIRPLFKGKKAVIVTDDVVSKLYEKQVADSLANNGIEYESFVFENGEHSKSHSTLTQLYDFLAHKQITRSDILIALGGGVVGDLTGFAAATYLRGLEVVQIPTTLLAQTDSSIGGKTAVNIKGGKNLVGAFKQPACVICDTDTLKTLSEEIYADGMSEVIKYGMIKDERLFETLHKKAPDMDIEKIIADCVNTKKALVECDEFDKGERMLLNFGHTLGHAIEKYYNYDGISHGKAVALGMCLMSELTEKAGMTQAGTTAMLINCLEKYGINTKTDIPLEILAKACLVDKKRDSDSINIIICQKVGVSKIIKLSIPELYNLLGVKNV